MALLSAAILSTATPSSADIPPERRIRPGHGDMRGLQVDSVLAEPIDADRVPDRESPEARGAWFVDSIHSIPITYIERITLPYAFSTSILLMPFHGKARITFENQHDGTYKVRANINKLGGLAYRFGKIFKPSAIPDVNTTLEGILAVESNDLKPRKFVKQNHLTEKEPEYILFDQDSIRTYPGGLSYPNRGEDDPMCSFFKYILTVPYDTLTVRITNFKANGKEGDNEGEDPNKGRGIDFTTVHTIQADTTVDGHNYTHVMKLKGHFLSLVQGDVLFTIAASRNYRLPVTGHATMNGLGIRIELEERPEIVYKKQGIKQGMTCK